MVLKLILVKFILGIVGETTKYILSGVLEQLHRECGSDKESVWHAGTLVCTRKGEKAKKKSSTAAEFILICNEVQTFQM